jgi:8-oxo-dGTP diphosphatase
VSARTVDVAAAVIERPDGSFLLAQRPQGKVYAGYWEFPGGKVEPGESSADALRRELREELGLIVQHAYPWISRLYTYPHATVRLQFHRVVGWEGAPHPREGQAFAWQRIRQIDVSPVLPANAPILKALELPLIYAITHAWQIGVIQALKALDSALLGGTRLVQIREPGLDIETKTQFAAEVVSRVRKSGGIALVNGTLDLARNTRADGVHLTSAALRAAQRRPECDWCAASCHDDAELTKAKNLGVDFVVLGPVLATPSHAGLSGLGWGKFAGLIQGFELPVYALGGMTRGELHQSRLYGAHGVAMLRGAWDG